MSWGIYRKVQIVFVPTESEVTTIDKGKNESVVTISYRIKFIDSARYKSC